MVTAISLLDVSRDRIHDLADELSDIPGITEVYSVSGRYDLAVIIRAKDNEQLENLITNNMLRMDGILKSETLIAFRVHSKHDLDTMFSIGMPN